MDRLDFSSKDHGIAYHNGSASVRIPLSSLFNGNIAPDKIRLRYGTLDLRLDGSASNPILPSLLVLEHIQINWRVFSATGSPDWHGELTDVELTLDALTRKVNATSPDFSLSAQWDKDGLPQQIKLYCKHTDWLPASILQHINHSPQVNLTVNRSDLHNWEINTTIASKQAITLHIAQAGDSYQFNKLSAKLRLSLSNDSSSEDHQSTLELIKVEQLEWSLADHKISAQGEWKDGLLTLQANAPQLPMPLIWSWLQPLGDEEWQAWLKLMQHGLAKQLKANLSLSWPQPLQAWPEAEAFDAMQYQVQALLENADIALGVSNGYLLHTRASVDLNQDSLTAQIEETTLPRKLGLSSGSLRIPFDTLMLHIKGKSNVDIASLLKWFGPSEVNDWKWNRARANSHFELLWDLAEDSPQEARITLQPDGIWNIDVLKFPLQLSQGKVHWDQNNGLSLKNMHLTATHMQGTFSFDAAAQGDSWKLTSLQAKGESQLAPLAAHFQLPMAHAGGSITSSLSYNGEWSGKLDMTHASWEHLLGSDKKTGELFSLQYHGLLDMKARLPTIHIDKLTSTGDHIKLHDGRASINSAGLKVQLNGLHTPSFSGKLDIDVPFDDNLAWKIDAKARYLNRNALPDSLDHSEKLIDKAWVLRADIDRFDWDDAHMSGVHIKLSSDAQSLGIMEAALIHTSQMDILDVDARFTLPGQGRVELRKFSASFEKQKLIMSATLTPETDGGMRWKGFAELHGDFGHLMKKGELSSRFLEGDARLLFSGQGLILKEQPWWQGLDGRLRMRVDQGRILEGGTLTTLLSAINLSKLPALLLGQRKDLSGPGIMYERLQMEAIMQNQTIHIRNVAMRSSAFDLVGQGNMDVDKNMIDLYLIAKPLQNLDALLAKIPFVRDILGGRAHSLMRKVYHLSGPFTDAQVKAIRPRDAGLSEAGIIERLFNIPNNWFGPSDKN